MLENTLNDIVNYFNILGFNIGKRYDYKWRRKKKYTI
jgi:hypothetical protein